MPALRTAAALMGVTAALAGPALAFSGAAHAADAGAVPGELIVRFSEDAGPADRAAARQDAGVELERPLAGGGLQLVQVDDGQAIQAVAEELEDSPQVLYAEPNFVRRIEALPDDPLFPGLWGLDNRGQSVGGVAGTIDADIDAPEAWNLTTGSSAVTAAVVDTGVDVSHADLGSSIWTNPGESGGGRESNGLDDDANGLVDDWRGWDWVTADNLPADENDHGTHAAGTIAASGDNSVGVTGVSWASRVMPLRVLDATGSGSVADLISAYRYAAAKGARIVNASLSGSSFSRAELDAINGAPGTLFVVAAGNGGDDGVGDDLSVAPEYPCAYPAPNIVCVAASDQDDRLAGFSNYGAEAVDLAAPGVRTASTVPGGYARFSGTSMATPHVAGVAALIWALEPTASVTGVKAALLTGTDLRPDLAGRTATGGRLNADLALRATSAFAGLPQATPLPSGTVPIPEGDTRRGVPAGETSSDRTAPRIFLANRSARRLRRALRAGLVLRARCTERCRLNLTVRISSLTARRAGLSRSRRPTIVSRVNVAAGSGARTVRIRLTRRARIRLDRLRRARFEVNAVAADGAGNRGRRSLFVDLRR
ncbi:MAG: S8 family peptidase [Thermoleophilaceae bacterium]